MKDLLTVLLYMLAGFGVVALLVTVVAVGQVVYAFYWACWRVDDEDQCGPF